LPRIFSLLERTAVLRGARCPGTTLAEDQVAGCGLFQRIDPSRRGVRSSSKAIRTSVAREAQQAPASSGASVPLGGEKSGELRALASRAGRDNALPAFEPIRR